MSKRGGVGPEMFCFKTIVKPSKEPKHYNNTFVRDLVEKSSGHCDPPRKVLLIELFACEFLVRGDHKQRRGSIKKPSLWGVINYLPIVY